MWYFAWALGLPLAVLLAVMNAIWLESKEDDEQWRAEHGPDAGL
mgnify:CR=1 FL=1